MSALRPVVLLAVAALLGTVMAATAVGSSTDGRGSFTDDDGSVHESDINGLAASQITRGCNPPDNTRYCPDSPVTRAQMASFLVRGLDGVDPILNRLSLRSGLSCSKDGLACSKRVSLAAGTRLQIREGWYQVTPYEPGEEAAFKDGGTRLSVTWDGDSVAGDYLGLSESASPATRMWDYRLPPLTSGTHTLRMAWRWVDAVHQTATITVTVP